MGEEKDLGVKVTGDLIACYKVFWKFTRIYLCSQLAVMDHRMTVSREKKLMFINIPSHCLASVVLWPTISSPRQETPDQHQKDS